MGAFKSSLLFLGGCATGLAVAAAIGCYSSEMGQTDSHSSELENPDIELNESDSSQEKHESFVEREGYEMDTDNGEDGTGEAVSFPTLA